MSGLVRKWHIYRKCISFGSSSLGLSGKCSGKLFCFFSHMTNEACFYLFELSKVLYFCISAARLVFIFVLISETGSHIPRMTLNFSFPAYTSPLLQ